MAKSSFSLFETILSLLILSILISGFSQFIYLKEDQTTSLNLVYPLLLTQTSHSNIQTSSLGYIRQGSNIVLTQGNSITQKIYQDATFKLERNYLNSPFEQEIAFKEFDK